jgi:hypothetical protein
VSHERTTARSCDARAVEAQAGLQVVSHLLDRERINLTGQRLGLRAELGVNAPFAPWLRTQALSSRT